MKARLLVVTLQCAVILVAAGFILGIMGSDRLAPWLRWTLALVLTASGVVLQASVCTHRHVTLQPAVKGSGPDRDHSRWYCHRCGRSWNASFETNTKPRSTNAWGLTSTSFLSPACQPPPWIQNTRGRAGPPAGPV